MNTDKLEKILGLLHMEVSRVEGDEVYSHCPGHVARTGKPDRSASWSINAESQQHFCFSCGYKGNLVLLVADQKQFSSTWGLPDWSLAKAWLETEVGLDLSDLPDRLDGAARNTYISLKQPIPMAESRLALFVDPPEWALHARGLTLEACQKYGVRWDDDKFRWITPVRHPISHKLMGWQEKGQKDRYFNNRPVSVKKSTALFGLDVYAGGKMIVVESPLDAVRLESVGITGGVATYGAMISAKQVELMLMSDELIIAMDNPHRDKAGYQACKDMLKASKTRNFEFSFLGYRKDDGKDPGDMTAREIFSSVERRRHCIRGEAAIRGS